MGEHFAPVCQLKTPEPPRVLFYCSKVSSSSSWNTKTLFLDLSLYLLLLCFGAEHPAPSLAFRINCTVILKLIPNCFTTHREKRANQLLFCFHLTEGDIMQMILST